MSFADTFASLLADQGITVDPKSLPSRSTVESSFDAIDSWLIKLDQSVREGFVEASAETACCFVLAEPDINVAPDIPSILAAFDQTESRSLTDLLSAARDCLSRADDD